MSRATFDAETRGLEPDYKLPDLILPGRPATGAPSQAEFVQVPADYMKEASIARLAEEGQRLMAKYRDALAAIEARFGVPGTIVLAIWGRETDYGRYTLPYDGLRVLATQAYVGRRKDKYRNEFILALKMIGDGEVTRKDMRASWAGATGLTQFLPSEFYKHGVDFDGDGHRDIWHSVPDALASAAQQLVNKGWQPGVRWAYEVQAPANVDCTMGVPEVTKPIGEWLRDGFVPVRGQKLSANEQAATGFAAAARGHLWPGVPDHEELLRDQGIQFLGSLCAVRRAPQRPHVEPAAVRDAVVGVDAIAHRRCRSDAASAHAAWSVYATSSTARRGCRPARRSAPTRNQPGSRWIAGPAKRCCVRSARRAEIKNPAEMSAGFQNQDAELAPPVRSQINCRPRRGGSATRNHPRSARERNGSGGAPSTYTGAAIIGRRRSGGGDGSADNRAADDSASDGRAEAALSAKLQDFDPHPVVSKRVKDRPVPSDLSVLCEAPPPPWTPSLPRQMM